MLKSKTRSSNIELFRIVTMLLIVAHHLMGFTGFTVYMRENPTEWQSIFLYLFGMWGKTGIDCFVLITGYFMCTSNITMRKFVKLLMEIEFYIIIVYLLFVMTDYTDFDILYFSWSVLPIKDFRSSFVDGYLILFLLIPIINWYIHSIGRKMHQLSTFLLIVLYYLFPYKSYMIWFPIVYLVAAYLRLYPMAFFHNTKIMGGALVISICLSMLSVYIFIIYGITPYYILVADSQAPFAIIVSVTAFLYFNSLKLRYNKLINAVASTTFGVLLIHSNSQLMRDWLFHDFLKCKDWYYSPYLVLYCFVVVIGIFVFCSIIDYMRICIIEKPIMRLLFDKK